ncbi:MAG: ribonuclease D [Coriobacteriales bacterium]|nr:ribonuclease D [Coriobacteriales bacterium]
MYLSTQEALNSFIEHCGNAEILAIDTEFLREKTYYPKLCLMQFATEDMQVIVDPLADGMDLRACKELLTRTSLLKVFHAGEQDRSIIFRYIGVPAAPVFDTQWAAMLLGLPQQASLAAVVKHYTSVELSKTDSFSDWSQRPLTDTQKEYALDDVRYLPAIARRMMDDLHACGRGDWLRDDFSKMEAAAGYRIDPDSLWHKVKYTASLNREQLARVQALAAWREATAQRRDLPRKWVLPDELLVEIARRNPDSPEALFSIRGLHEKLGKHWIQDVLNALAQVRKLPETEWPQRERPRNHPSDVVGILDLMNALVRIRAKELHIAHSYLATSDELTRLASGERSALAILEGWRRECIGNELLDLLKGEIMLSLVDGELKVTRATR